MAPTRDLQIDIAGGDSLLAQAPYWVVGIARFKTQVTADPINIKPNGEHVGDRALNVNPIEETLLPLVLTDSVAQIRVNAAKESHISSMTLILYPDSDYIAGVHTGDWIVGCIVDNETKGQDIKRRMFDKEPINNPDDGLKFLGRINSISKQFQMTPQGTLQSHYEMECVGFGEFSSQFYFHPQMNTDSSTPVALAQFGMMVNKITDATDGNIVTSGTVDIEKVIPRMLEVFFGEAPWANAPGANGQEASANKKYLIPETIARWFGAPNAKTYNEIFTVMMGVQHYTNNGDDPGPLAHFLPDDIAIIDGIVHTGAELTGWFPLNAPPPEGTIWDWLFAYSNAPINEMYITLRVGIDGKIRPHLILRQTPYTTNMTRALIAAFNTRDDLPDPNKQMDEPTEPVQDLPDLPPDVDEGTVDVPIAPERPVEMTDFFELPRWVLPASMVVSGRVSRSDATRFNLVYVGARVPGEPPENADVRGFVFSPPITDSVDIQRNGIKPYQASVNAGLRNYRNAPSLYRDMMADVVMGQHLTLSAQLTTVGISAPIPTGDNLQFENVVFHIEAIAHSAGISPSGQRFFQTTLMCSHGVDNEIRGNSLSRGDRFPGLNDTQGNIGGSRNNITRE